MNQFHPAKPAGIFRVSMKVYWGRKVYAFCEAIRKGGIYGMNERILPPPPTPHWTDTLYAKRRG